MIKPSRYSRISLQALATCHPDLQAIFNEAIEIMDIRITCGYRGEEEQNSLFNEGLTTKPYPNSKHNQRPSLAVDAAPYPIRWHETERFVFMAGVVMGIAARRGIKLRWGGNWDNDQTIMRDQTLQDLVHFELEES